MTDHGQQTFERAAPVDVAIAPAHWTQCRAEVGADTIEDRFAKGEAARTVTDEWRENIGFAQGESGGDAQSFLAASEEDAAVNFSRTVKAGELVIQNTGQEHEPAGAEIQITRGSNITQRFRLQSRLNHGNIFATSRRARNVSFRATRGCPGSFRVGDPVVGRRASR